MKTLLKTFGKKNVLPVLNTVKLTSGYMTATNLDMYLIGPAPLWAATKPPGLYLIEGLKTGLALPAGIDAADFPPFTAGDYVGTVRLDAQDLANLAALKPAISTESTRYYLNGVNFEGRDMVATTGHILLKAELSGDQSTPADPGKAGGERINRRDGEGFIVPGAAVDVILGLAKELKAAGAALDFHTRGLQISMNGWILFTKYIDGTFPDYNRVIPAKDKTGGLWTKFNPEHVEAVIPDLRALQKIAGEKRSASIALEFEAGRARSFYDENKTYNLNINSPASVAYNADYMAAMPAGDWIAWDSMGPALVLGEHVTGVIMPMRTKWHQAKLDAEAAAEAEKKERASKG